MTNFILIFIISLIPYFGFAADDSGAARAGAARLGVASSGRACAEPSQQAMPIQNRQYSAAQQEKLEQLLSKLRDVNVNNFAHAKSLIKQAVKIDHLHPDDIVIRTSTGTRTEIPVLWAAFDFLEIELFEFLLRNHASPNSVSQHHDFGGEALLVYIARSPNAESLYFMQRLLKNGVNIDAAGRHGESALSAMIKATAHLRFTHNKTQYIKQKEAWLQKVHLLILSGISTYGWQGLLDQFRQVVLMTEPYNNHELLAFLYDDLATTIHNAIVQRTIREQQQIHSQTPLIPELIGMVTNYLSDTKIPTQKELFAFILWLYFNHYFHPIDKSKNI